LPSRFKGQKSINSIIIGSGVLVGLDIKARIYAIRQPVYNFRLVFRE
jgi:hypothetical protein